MSTQRQYKPHYRVSDYLQWSGDWELWFGTAIAMTPSPFAPHERLVTELVYQLQCSIKQQACDCTVYSGLDWIVCDDTVVRPDVMVVCGQQPSDYLRRSPSLAIEVLSPSTTDKDLGPKRDLYQQCGVDHYLIVDPQSLQLTWLQLNDGQYHEQDSDQNSVIIPLHEQCALSIAL